jgi:hypothetical protein
MFELSSRMSDSAVNEKQSREAFEQAGLTVETRAARFTVSWPGIVEWIRLRWMTVADDQNRGLVAKVLADVEGQARGRSVELEEGLILGRLRAA